MGFFLLLYYIMLTEALGLTHLSWDKAVLIGVAWFMWAAHAPPATPPLDCCHRPLEEGLAHLSIPTTSTPELTMRLLAVLSWLWDVPCALGCPLSAIQPSVGIFWLVSPFFSTKFVLWKANSRCSPMWGTLLLSESSYSWQVLPCPSMDRNPLPTGEGPAYHSYSAAFNDFDLYLGYWQVLPVQSKKSSSFHHRHWSFHFKNNAFQCQLGQQLLLED